MLYIIYNHTTGTESTMTQSELESIYTELKSGTMEIVDEIDPTFTIPDDCISSLW